MRYIACVRVPVLLLALVLASDAMATVILAEDPVVFDSQQKIRFTDRQVARTAAATREGLVRWAATEEGRRILRHFTATRCEVFVREDVGEPGMGRAPQPGIATLVASRDDAKRKVYELILNPISRDVPKQMKTLPNHPATTADFLAAAWAAEMLHIEFYSRGILLPHHRRADFQERWEKVAAQLGFPTMTHDDEHVEPRMRRDVVIIGGEESWRRD
jgi:hypothetical protein